MKKIAVFCGSNIGNNPLFEQAATDLGSYLALNHYEIIYGGSKIGLMGRVANSALEHGAKITGIIPEFLKNKETVHEKLDQLITVDTMNKRKELMIKMSDGFVILPGGIGTFEEVFEVLSQLQLLFHEKPIGFLNVKNYFESFIKLMSDMVDAGFAPIQNSSLFITSNHIPTLFDQMKNYKTIPFNKKMKL